MHKVRFIINPKSGTPKFVSRLESIIRKHLPPSRSEVSVVISETGCDIKELAMRAVDDGNELVVAVGGDGTVNQAAAGLLHTQAALGVLPTGSGNGFARNLGIPLRVDSAMKLLQHPDIITIDVGHADEHIFLVSCGIGWEAVIATLFEGSHIRGILPYAGVAISTFLQYEPLEISIEAEPNGWSYRGRPMLFSVTNMKQYGVGVTIAPEADFQDGLLDICLLPRHSLVNALKYTPEMFRQRTDAIPGYVHQLATKVTVHRHLAGNIHVDGTPMAAGHRICIHIAPQALRVAVAKESL